MALDGDDYRLSMKVSLRGKVDAADLRSLLVNRLSDTEKVVMRRPLRQIGKPTMSAFCEPCDMWVDGPRGFPEEWDCPKCGRTYRVETVIYEEVDPG